MAVFESRWLRLTKFYKILLQLFWRTHVTLRNACDDFASGIILHQQKPITKFGNILAQLSAKAWGCQTFAISLGFFIYFFVKLFKKWKQG